MKNNQLLNILCIYLSFSTMCFSQLSTLSDEFNNSILDASWNLFQTQYYQTPGPMNNGLMEMNLDDVECSQTCVWFLARNAGLIYKEVTGDFDVVSAVFTKQKSNPSQDIGDGTQLAGLIARDPASTTTGLEYYIFNVTGMRFNNASIELKSTTNDKSAIKAYTNNMLSGTSAEVRMVREGSVFSLYSRPIGGSTWLFRHSYTRTDLPATLQVGLIAYVYNSNPGNLLAQFDYIRFSSVDNTLSNDEFDDVKHTFNIYPNTVKDELNIEFNSKSTSTISISIFNVLGRKIHDEVLNYSSDATLKTKIDLTPFNVISGVYFLRLKSDEANFGVYKFIKS